MNTSLITDFSSKSNDPDFPFANVDWSREFALSQASEVGLELSEDHWEAIRALQSFFARHEDTSINLRELHDALDEKFHQKGGIKYLYTIFPGGPVNQACKIAGITPPPGSANLSFGSVG